MWRGAGNYDSYVKTRAELEEAQMKKYKWEQEQIADMKEYIARFGHGSAKLARQAQSKEKTLEKMVQSSNPRSPAPIGRLKLHFPRTCACFSGTLLLLELCFSAARSVRLTWTLVCALGLSRGIFRFEGVSPHSREQGFLERE